MLEQRGGPFRVEELRDRKLLNVDRLALDRRLDALALGIQLRQQPPQPLPSFQLSLPKKRDGLPEPPQQRPYLLVVRRYDNTPRAAL